MYWYFDSVSTVLIMYVIGKHGHFVIYIHERCIWILQYFSDLIASPCEASRIPSWWLTKSWKQNSGTRRGMGNLHFFPPSTKCHVSRIPIPSNIKSNISFLISRPVIPPVIVHSDHRNFLLVSLFIKSSSMLFWCNVSLLLAVSSRSSQAFVPLYRVKSRPFFLSSLAAEEKPTGSFFNEIPEDKSGPDGAKDDIDGSLDDLLKGRKKPTKASEPSTIQGIPISGARAFAKTPSTAASSKKPYIGLGPPDRPLNDTQNPEYDDQGYMLYADEETGEKKRVFEALVEYPSIFTMKIVGAAEGTFVEDMVQVVADSCDKDVADIAYSTKNMGKWVSVTVEAPVANAEMLYSLYENVDRDPRVKFKF